MIPEAAAFFGMYLLPLVEAGLKVGRKKKKKKKKFSSGINLRFIAPDIFVDLAE